LPHHPPHPHSFPTRRSSDLLAAQYPVVAKLLEYRTMQKALTSYGANMVEFINPTTGRLHADFRQIGAPTGRFACTNPNIQQVPQDRKSTRLNSSHVSISYAV